MDNGFLKFKKRIMLEFILKVIIVSLSVSILIPAILLIVFKLIKYDFATFYYFIIGCCLFILICFLSYFIFKPNDLKIGIKLDKALNLNQKVETYVAYKDDQGLIAQVQREDTLNKLNELDAKQYKIHIKPLYFIMLFISIIVLVVGILIPKDKTNNTNKPIDDNLVIDDDYEVDEATLLKIDALISYVNESELVDDYKALYVNELTTLKDNLKLATKESQKNNYAKRCINNFEKILSETNSNTTVYHVLKKSDSNEVKTLAYAIQILDVDQVTTKLSDLRGVLNVPAIDFENAIADLKTKFGDLIENSGIDTNDILTFILLKLSNDLNALIGNTPTASKFDSIFNDAKAALVVVVQEQKTNYDVETYVESSLRQIFGIPKEIEDDSNSDEDITETDEDKNNSGNSGGAGSGETIYAGDDVMFDYELGSVKYGDVIDTYYMRILEMFNEGLISEEYKDSFIKYYEALYTKEEE